MLKKVVLTSLFVVAAAFGAVGSVAAKSSQQTEKPTVARPAPQGFCPMGLRC